MLNPYDQNPEPGPFTTDMHEHMPPMFGGGVMPIAFVVVAMFSLVIVLGPGVQNARAVNAANQETCDAR